ncbi:MAG: Bacillopeptidase F precursor [candidate division WS6 bacterium OLB20]|uniref:Bacillopeptidase F n=1 Tax=candidate division WS6 bacterium OLB20 TaxID=1617426 RepID=A0A136M0G9_9BACT|nr:MAG: Bacillopeptidase F precursor [candidate division WS6 bacterium OLB20]
MDTLRRYFIGLLPSITSVRKSFSITVMILMFAGSFPVSRIEAFSGSGSGTELDPYVITDCTELQEIDDELDAHYVLANDIDCSFVPGTTIYTEDFETGAAGWGHSGTNDSWNIDSESCTQTFDSTAYGTNGNSGSGCSEEQLEVSELISPVISLTSAAHHYIQFDSWADDENGPCTDSGDYDSKDVAVTTDGGSSYTVLNDCFALHSTESVDGEFTTWRLPISGFANEDIQLMFRYDTEDDCCGYGWYVDNIVVGEGFVFTPIGDNIDRFTGSLDGAGYAINNLELFAGDYTGLFGVIDEGGEVFDLSVNGVLVNGGDYTGSIAGISYGTITDVSVTGSVSGGDYTGGLVGAHADPDGLGSSSPLVFTWDGDSYEFQVDVGGTLPSTVNGEDHAALRDGSLAPRGDKYDLKISQEYDEIVYYDELQLFTVDHAPGFDVAASIDRNLTGEYFSFAESPTHPLVSCTDKWGNDCLAQLAESDDDWSTKNPGDPDNFWVLDFGDLSDAEDINLIAEGFSDYTIDTVTRFKAIQVKDADGNWVDAYPRSQIDPPKGAPRTSLISLKDLFITDDYSVKVAFPRARMNWFAVDTTPQTELTVTGSYPSSVNLRFGGYTEADKTVFWDHDYRQRSNTPFEFLGAPAGKFTKYGDITPLLSSPDNQFAVLRHGDWMDVEFDYTPAADGLERSFVLQNWVLYKHWDKGAWARTVEPLPFHGMTEYPYLAPESYPYTPENTAYLEEWNTREYFGGGVQSNTIIDSSADVDVEGCDYTGGLVGYNLLESITGSSAHGNVYSECDDVGGLVGYNSEGSIEESFATGSVEGDEYVGGAIGSMNDSGSAYRVYATGNVTGYYRVGGFIGRNQYGFIEESYATGEVYGDESHVGGFAGGSGGDSEILNSYSRGDVTGYDYVGGFAGNNGGVINNSYSTGYVLGDETDGGFVAYSGGGPAESNFSFWDEDTSGLSYSEQGTGRTTAEMKSSATFTTDLGADSWDFDTVWGIDPGYNDGYPDFLYNLPADDADGDGIDDSVEDAGPNGGDANGDSISDSTQANVTTFVGSVSGNYVSMESTCDTIAAADIIEETENGMDDEAFDYTAGLFDFELTCAAPGETATVTMYFFGDYDASLVTVRKFNGVNDEYLDVPGAVATNSTIGGEDVLVITFDITDGGPLDMDGTANGTIIDPTGPAFNTAAAPQTGLGGSQR